MIIAYHILLMLLYVIRLYVKYYYNIYIYKAFLYSIILAMLAMITWGGRPAPRGESWCLSCMPSFKSLMF